MVACRQRCNGAAKHAALGYEFTLYLLRNPEARERLAVRRSEVVAALGKFITEGVDRLGGTLGLTRELRPDPDRHQRRRRAG